MAKFPGGIVQSFVSGIQAGSNYLDVPGNALLDGRNVHFGEHGALSPRHGDTQYPSSGSAVGASAVCKGLLDFHRDKDTTRRILAWWETGGAGGIYRVNGTGWDTLLGSLATGRPQMASLGNYALINGSNHSFAVQVYDHDETDHEIRDIGVVHPGRVIRAVGTEINYSGVAFSGERTANPAATPPDPTVVFDSFTTGQYFYVGVDFGLNGNGDPNPPTAFLELILYIINANGTAGTVLHVDYSLKSGGGVRWADLGATDGTKTGTTTLGLTGFRRIHWPVSPSNWARLNLFGKEQHWVRLWIDNGASGNATLDSDVKIGMLFPAGRTTEFVRRKSGSTKVWRDTVNDNTAATTASVAGVGGSQLGEFLEMRTRSTDGPPPAGMYLDFNNGTTNKYNTNNSSQIDEIQYKAEEDDQPRTPMEYFLDDTLVTGTFQQHGVLRWEVPDGIQPYNPANSSERGKTDDSFWAIRLKFNNAALAAAEISQCTPLYAGTVIMDPTVYTDWTAEATDFTTGTGNDVEVGGLDTTDALYVCIDDLTRAVGLQVTMGAAVNSVATMLVPHYFSNLQTWKPFDDYVDETATGSPAVTSLAQSGRLLWAFKPDDWITSVLPDPDDSEASVIGYFVKLVPSTDALSATCNIDELRMVQSHVPKAKSMSVFNGSVFLYNCVIEEVLNGEVVTTTYARRGYFSKVGEVDEWDHISDWIDLSSGGEDILASSHGIPSGRHQVVWTERNTFVVQLNQSAPLFTVHHLSSTVGCTGGSAWTQGQGFIAWWSDRGPMALSHDAITAGVEGLKPMYIGESIEGLVLGTQDGRWTALNKSMFGDIAAYSYTPRGEIRFLVSSSGQAAHDMELVYNYSVSGPDNHVWTINTHYRPVQAATVITDDSAPGGAIWVYGSTNGKMYQTEASAASYADDGQAIPYRITTGWFAEPESPQSWAFRYLRLWVWQNASQGITFGIAMDGGTSNRYTSTTDTYGRTPPVRIGLQRSNGRKCRVDLQMAVAGKAFGLRAYGMELRPLGELR